MIHARPDYNRIQDPAGKIGVDEPVFLIRAQDKSAPETLRFWADENTRNDGDPAASRLAEQWADKMEEWQKAHGSKPADLPDAALLQSDPQAPAERRHYPEEWGPSDNRRMTCSCGNSLPCPEDPQSSSEPVAHHPV